MFTGSKMSRKFVSVVTPCYNEEENIDELVHRVREVLNSLPYQYEHIIIDNASTDETVTKVKVHAASDPRIKLIVNTRNFGHIRSPFHGILQARGDAVLLLASDLQDPPEMIPLFISHWEKGFRVVLATKPESDESSSLFMLRKAYYSFLGRISETPLIANATGAGLFDRTVVEILRQVRDPYPYFRGLLCEIGYEIATVDFRQPRRSRGITKNNFYTLYDIAMLGITNHSKVPLRIMTLLGFTLAFGSFLVSFVFLVAKLIYWDAFELGMSPLIVGMFFLGAVQLFFIGMLGEYIGSIHTRMRSMPLVIEKERLNFDTKEEF